MNRRTFAKGLAGIAAALALTLQGFPANVTKPNVVLILTDDQGWWDLGINGNRHIETPVLDQLALEGARFTHFYASPKCSPTRASLLTGRHYQRTGVRETYYGYETLRSDEVTIAEVFQKHGYRTGLVGKWHLGRYMKYHPNNRGFDEFFGFWQPPGQIQHYFDPDELFWNKRPVTTSGYITDILTDQAISFIQENRTSPFFLYLPYNANHFPYLVPDSYIEKYLKKGLPMTDARIYGMVTSVDENVGRLLKTIDEAGIRDSTAIIFMSDNGGVSHTFKAGLRDFKGSVYEGGVRVPFFARWPGKFPAGTRIDAMAQHIDILPTICELIGVPLPTERKIDGKSILSLLRQGRGESPHKYLFHQFSGLSHTWQASMPISANRMNWAVQSARGFKLVMSHQRNGTSHPQEELFNLENDPSEASNIAARHPDIVRALRDEFEKWFYDVTKDQYYKRVPIEVGRSDEDPVDIEVTWGESVGEKVRPTFHNVCCDTVDNWTEVNDYVRWTIDVVVSGRYAVNLTYGCRRGDEGSKLRISVGTSQIEHVVSSTGGRNLFRPVGVGTLTLPRGLAVLEIAPISIKGEELLALHKISLKKVESH